MHNYFCDISLSSNNYNNYYIFVTEDSIDDLVMSNEDVTANLRESIAEDLEKGKAVKNQISELSQESCNAR